MKCNSCQQEKEEYVSGLCKECSESMDGYISDNSQRKKDESPLSDNHLEAQSRTGEDNRREHMPDDVDTHADTTMDIKIKEQMLETIQPRVTSGFGQGLCYCLGLFLSHSERSYYLKEDQKEIKEIMNKPSLWFNAASDHLYDLQIPQTRPEELKTRLKEFQTKCINWGHGFPMVEATESDMMWSIDEAKRLLILIDEFYGVDTIPGDYQ